MKEEYFEPDYDEEAWERGAQDWYNWKEAQYNWEDFVTEDEEDKIDYSDW